MPCPVICLPIPTATGGLIVEHAIAALGGHAGPPLRVIARCRGTPCGYPRGRLSAWGCGQRQASPLRFRSKRRCAHSIASIRRGTACPCPVICLPIPTATGGLIVEHAIAALGGHTGPPLRAIARFSPRETQRLIRTSEMRGHPLVGARDDSAPTISLCIPAESSPRRPSTTQTRRLEWAITESLSKGHGIPCPFAYDNEPRIHHRTGHSARHPGQSSVSVSIVPALRKREILQNIRHCAGVHGQRSPPIRASNSMLSIDLIT